MRRSRWPSLSCLLALLVTSACIESAKTPAAKAVPPTSAAKSGSGPVLAAARHAGLNTAVLRAGGLDKGVDRIAPDRTVEGVLAADETTTAEGKHQDLWILTLDAPADVRITLSSPEFDAWLDMDEVVGEDASGLPVLEHFAEDDDGAGGTDAGLEGRVEAGTYVVFATSYAPGQSGRYTLTVAGGGPESAEGAAFSTTVEPGGVYEGTLTKRDALLEADGTFYQLVRFRGHAGERLVATLSSGDFDPFLWLALGSGGWGTLDVLAQSDDADATTLDSRIALALPEDGVYTLVVNTVGSAIGSYRLAVDVTPADYSAFASGPSDPAGRYALLVGIDDYPGTGADLAGPTRDAEGVAATLVEVYGFDPQNVLVLRNEEATRPNIAHAIVGHLGKAGPDGVAVFFYSGHGTRVGDNVGYLDEEADGQDDGLYVYGYGEESSVLLDEELAWLFTQVRGRTLIAVDACFSGTISRAPGAQAKRVETADPEVAGRLRLPKTFIDRELGDGYAFGYGASALADVFDLPERNVVLSSSSEEQVSWTEDAWPDGSPPMSLFTYYLVKELRAAGPELTLRELSRRVDEQVDAHVQATGGKFQDQDAQLLGPGLDRTVRAYLGAGR